MHFSSRVSVLGCDCGLRRSRHISADGCRLSASPNKTKQERALESVHFFALFLQHLRDGGGAQRALSIAADAHGEK